MDAQNADPNACPFGGSWNTESSVDATAKEDLPAMYTGDGESDDFDKATNAKMEASDLKSTGNFSGALDKYTEAILAAEPLALLLANRAHCLLKLERYPAACTRFGSAEAPEIVYSAPSDLEGHP